MIGFDYTERIDPAALKAAGCSVVFRYLSNPGWPKNLTAAEARELLAAGIPIVLNYETDGTFMLGGYSAGVSAARSARAQANVLGAPANTRIYYSADFDATTDQIPTILAFDRGAASVDGDAEVGGYGGLRVALAEDAAGFSTWQTIAWSGGQWDTHALARQTGAEQTVGGVRVDVNEIIDLAGLGAWGGPTTTASGDAVPNIPPSISQKWPDIAGDFPPNAPYTDDTALIWSDAGSRAAALYAREARDAINALASRIAQPPAIDVNALAAALAPHLTAGATAEQIAHAVVAHLGSALAAG